jgi:SAM-dependent methyltransferase
MSAAAPPQPAAVVWHDAECGAYAADLPVWERLADLHGNPVLDLGAGSGRVALHLAARGHEVVAVDSDAALLGALAERARERSTAVETVVADVRELDLGGRRFPLVIAPMQLAHLLGGPDGRARALAGVAAHLEPGGALALAVLHEPLPPSGTPDPLPDVREVDGWVHSSLPLAVRVEDDVVELDRLRQIVAPDGELTEERVTTRLDRLPPALLDRELAAAGFAVARTEAIAETPDHVGSLLVVAERGDRDA